MKASLILIWAITLATVFLQAAAGLLQALLPMRMNDGGLSASAVSFVVSAYGVGFTLGCFTAPKFIRHVGHIRAYASLAAVVAIIVLLFAQASSTVHWIILRGAMGFAMAGLFTISDGWISGSASSSHRGRILSIYTICTKVALMVSPLFVTPETLKGPELFMLASGLFSLALIPLAATHSGEPVRPASVNLHLRRLYLLAPSAVVGSFGVGLMSSPIANMASLYGVQIGLPENVAAQLLVALQGGSLFFQWPLGWLSDRFDRRYVIIAMCIGSLFACCMVLLASTMATNPNLILLAFVAWGGTALCIYSVCVAHACDMVPPNRVVPTVSGLLMVWAVGSAIGPIPAGQLMSFVGPHGMFYWSGSIIVFMILFITWRTTRLQRVPTRGGFDAVQPLTTLTNASEETTASTETCSLSDCQTSSEEAFQSSDTSLSDIASHCLENDTSEKQDQDGK